MDVRVSTYFQAGCIHTEVAARATFSNWVFTLLIFVAGCLFAVVFNSVSVVEQERWAADVLFGEGALAFWYPYQAGDSWAGF